MMKFLVLFIAFVCASARKPELWLNRQGDDWTRIIKGVNASKGEFPYIASFTGNSHVCGATILTKKWALTAAHCCPREDWAQYYKIVTGMIYLTEPGPSYQVEEIIIHERYLQDSLWLNDICLLKLKNPIQFGENVKQVTLPKQDTEIKSGDKLTIAGWGIFNPDQFILSDRLLKSDDFKALSLEECQEVTKQPIVKEHLCAWGGPGQNAWNGDSGGPLLRNGVQIGIVSWGFRPYGSGKPDVYTRLPLYTDWIKKKLGKDAAQLLIQ